MGSLTASPNLITMASVDASSTFSSPSLAKSSLSLNSNSSTPKFLLLTSKPQFHPLQLTPKLRVSASSAAPSLHPTPSPSITYNRFSSSFFSNSTRSMATILALGVSLSKLLAEASKGISMKFKKIHLTPTPEELSAIQKLQGSLVCTIGPLFLASIRSRPKGYLNTPLTVVAKAMSKWLDIYSGVLMVRILLSWFPNIPWDRQPLSAIRDLCDPYLNLFRNIIPPIFDTLDVSPLLAFAVLGTLGSILNNSTGVY